MEADSSFFIKLYSLQDPLVVFIPNFQIETRNKVFAEKLETLLHRAYHLQEDFGSTIPTESVLEDFGEPRVELTIEIKDNNFCARLK